MYLIIKQLINSKRAFVARAVTNFNIAIPMKVERSHVKPKKGKLRHITKNLYVYHWSQN